MCFISWNLLIYVASLMVYEFQLGIYISRKLRWIIRNDGGLDI